MRPKIPQVLKAGGRTIHFLVNVPGRRQRDPAALSGPHHLARAETFGPESLAVHSAAHWYVVQRFKSQVLRLLTPNSVLGWYITYINILENICENIYIWNPLISMISLPPKKSTDWTCEIQLKECPSEDGRRKEQRLALERGALRGLWRSVWKTWGEPWENHGRTMG